MQQLCWQGSGHDMLMLIIVILFSAMAKPNHAWKLCLQTQALIVEGPRLACMDMLSAQIHNLFRHALPSLYVFHQAFRWQRQRDQELPSGGRKYIHGLLLFRRPKLQGVCNSSAGSERFVWGVLASGQASNSCAGA